MDGELLLDLAGARVVVLVEHIVRHKSVLVAVDKQHGNRRVFELLHAARLMKVVARAHVAYQVCYIEQGKAGQAEHVLELQRKLVPNTRITAVLDNAFHVCGQRFPRDVHGGCRTHRLAKDQDARLGVSLNDSLDPCDDVEALGPAHADIVAAGALVGACGGCEYVHAAVVESLDVSGHTDGLVGISMQADGVVVRALRRSKIPGGKLGPVVRGEAAALAVFLKPRPCLALLGVHLLALFGVLAILHHLHGVRRLGVQGKVKQKVAGKPQQRDNEHQRNDAGYLELSMGTCVLRHKKLSYKMLIHQHLMQAHYGRSPLMRQQAKNG